MNGYEFEKQVCSILYKTNPYHLSHYDGGPDRGRDICIQYVHDNKKYNVIVECKYYTSGVTKDAIMPALDWATIHQPELFYLWIVPYLTPAAKDFIQEFEKRYKIPVRYEEQVNIDQYLKYMDNDNAKIWSTLRRKILDACADSEYVNLFVPEYDPKEADDIPFLIDREPEREKLLHQAQKAFYLQGVSACGKTQLLKYVAFIYSQKGLPIFWHTVRPASAEEQCRDFYHSFARYFESVHRDSTLLTYFKQYGFFLSQDMENLVISMLKLYNPILFIDDAHNCQNENISMRTLFKKLIKHQVCRVYFSGWFNIFDMLPDEKSIMSTVVLEGMKKNELDLIIQHCSGKHNPEIAELIEEHFYGLPGYAVLTDDKITVNEIEGSDGFLTRFLMLLQPQEQVVLFALSFLSTDVPGEFLQSSGYAVQVASLKKKNLLIVRKRCYAVHDKYRSFFRRYTIEDPLLQEIVQFMEKYATTTPSAFLDLISFQISKHSYVVAWNIFSSNFRLLISHQFYVQLISFLQEIERNTHGDININSIILKKIVLLERLGEYNICLQYIRLLNDSSLFDLPEQEMVLYIQLRCLYFTNKYDDILETYKKNYERIEAFQDRELYIQILLIIGRVFYIRGSSKGALIFYLLSYQQAFESHMRTLEVKAIHRIAMIERRLGMAKVARKTFEALAKLDSLITPKRRSYIYFRIAKCFLNEDNLEQAKIYNEKSIKIKTSYNDIRGLLFSDRLNAKIALKEGKFLDVYCSSTKACERAKQLGLRKEWLAATLIKLQAILLETSDMQDLSNFTSDMCQCLEIATEEKLLLRLKSIEKLTKEHWPNIYLSAQQSERSVEAELKRNEEELVKHYIRLMNSEMQKHYETLILNSTPISRCLLLQSGFIDPFEGFI